MAPKLNQQVPPQQPEHQNRLMAGGIALLGIAAVAALAVLGGQSSFEPTQPPDTASAHTALARTLSPQVSLVRVDAGGNAVIAGTSAPNVKVTIKTNNTVVGTANTDTNGAFAFVTSKPLPSGDQDITLSARAPHEADRISERGVKVSVPAAPSEGALAVLSSKTLLSSRLLGHHEPQLRALAIGSVDYNGSGGATIAGTATPDNQVELFMGTTKLGDAIAGADGRWEMHTNALPKQPGTFHLKALGAHGSVVEHG